MLNLPKRIVDLSHPLRPGIPSWELHCGFQCVTDSDYVDGGFRVQSFKAPLGIGTHMDAPAHCCPGGRTVDQLLLTELLLPCVVIDIRAVATEQYSLSKEDIKAFENQHGVIPAHSLVIVYTGWDRFWSEPERYHNHYRFPSVSLEAAEHLLKREIKGLGIDTLSPDRPESAFAVHRLLLGKDKFLIENIANAKCLPATGSTVLALPMAIEHGTEAPIRLVAFMPDPNDP